MSDQTEERKDLVKIENRGQGVKSNKENRDKHLQVIERVFVHPLQYSKKIQISPVKNELAIQK